MYYFSEKELKRHEEMNEDYPDARPTYETVKRYIETIRHLQNVNAALQLSIVNLTKKRQQIKSSPDARGLLFFFAND